MADPILDATNAANFGLGPKPDPQQDAPMVANPNASSLPDEYAPPTMPNNVIQLPQLMRNKYFATEVEPDAVQNAQQFEGTRNLLTNIIKQKESTGNYQAVNTEKVGNTASGAYQYTDSTWNNYGGYPKAALAPKEVQDRRFQEDITNRLAKYNGDPYKAIAEHYLPALASDPTKWNQSFRVRGRTVQPVLNYVRYVVKGTPLEAGLDDYLVQQHQQPIGSPHGSGVVAQQPTNGVGVTGPTS